LSELVNSTAPAFPLLSQWVTAANTNVEILEPSQVREGVLLDVQVTTRSVLGALAYETGGLLIDHGWLRLLGSGHPRLPRSLSAWNAGRADGFYLVGDDAAGGFFAINGGTLGPETHNVYYLAPDTLRWESMRGGFSQFVQWCLSGSLAKFYEGLRWSTWAADCRDLDGDHCFAWFPPLWVRPDGQRQRARIPIAEAWGMALDFKAQLGDD